MESPGKGKSEDGPTREEFAEQIVQLTYLVQEMKDGFVSAMQELSVIQSEDLALHDQVTKHKEDVNNQLTDLTNAVKEIKTEMREALSKVKQNTAATQHLSEQVEHLQYERTLLIKNSEVVRKKHLKTTYRAETPDHEDDNRKEKLNDSDADVADEKLDISNLSILDYDSDASNDELDLDNKEEYYKDLGEKDSAMSDMEEKQVDGINVAVKRVVELGRRNEGSGASCSSSFGATDFPPKQTEYISSEEALRQTLAKQFLESERRYVNQLLTTQEQFNNPLLGEGFIPQPDISLMFPNELASLLQIHKSLLASLHSRLNTWKWQGMMGDILARITDTYNVNTLEVYTSYIANFPRSLSKISYYCQKSHTYRKFLRKQLSGLGFIESDLVSNLLSPVQRIPQYVIFLKQLSKCTTADHPDYIYVQSSMKRLNDFVTDHKTVIETAIETTKDFPIILYKRKENKSSNYCDNTSMNAKSPSQVSSTKDSGIHSNDEQIPESRTNRLIEELSHTHQLLSELAASPVFQLKSTDTLHGSQFSDFRSKAMNKYHAKSRNKTRLRQKMLQFRSAPSLNSMNAGFVEELGQSDDVWMKNSNVDSYPDPNLAKSQPALARYGLLPSNHNLGQLGLIHSNHGNVAQLTGGYSLMPDMVIPHAEINDISNSPYLTEKFDFSKPRFFGSKQQRTLPSAPTYGIYGADDTDLDSVCYVPSTLTNAPSRTMQLRTRNTVNARVEESSKITGCDDGESSSFPIRESPVRDAEDLMYKSLPIIAPCESPVCQKSSDTYGTPTYDSMSVGGASVASEHSKHFSQPDLRKISQSQNRKKENMADNAMPTPMTVWHEAKEDELASDHKVKSHIKRRVTEDSKVSSKKSFKDSLKNIFFRKRGQTSKIVQITEHKSEPELKERSDELFCTRTMQPVLGSTYQDENGDPCSTV
ncbi:rho guanine nucleotide exchange factor 33-like [Anneissia japonica]|uniref:rho guanine nucleotide exchange factor 33-like n=1 Tax=Anneissia japonica TaxID=1529436 RepID=UPI0014259F50|nr:rho guanine nucleotide exchange factor 33-like [Anneissia japonica]XP_033109048.1 rho guanine nucleotide exchange factor 33-like [Anneissia japonica]